MEETFFVSAGESVFYWSNASENVLVISGDGPVSGRCSGWSMIIGYGLSDSSYFNAFERKYCSSYFDEPEETTTLCFDKTTMRVVISEGIKIINRYAFGGLAALSELFIPDSITDIDENAFDYVNYKNLRAFVRKNELAERFFKEKGSNVIHLPYGMEYEPWTYAGLPLERKKEYEEECSRWIEKISYELDGKRYFRK